MNALQLHNIIKCRIYRNPQIKIHILCSHESSSKPQNSPKNSQVKTIRTRFKWPICLRANWSSYNFKFVFYKFVNLYLENFFYRWEAVNNWIMLQLNKHLFLWTCKHYTINIEPSFKSLSDIDSIMNSRKISGLYWHYVMVTVFSGFKSFQLFFGI